MSNKADNNHPKYVVFDAEGKILGRLATEIAKVLSGKNKVDFMPNVGGSDWAIVINSDNVRLSGMKAKKKIYWKHSGYPGGITSISFDDLVKKDSTKIIELAVKGMLPKNKLSREAMKRLRVFKGQKHDFDRQLKGQEGKGNKKDNKLVP